MKESKFIELLNLYVDHQISPAEAALLEVEVKNNPGRRRVYREYCQMQKACAALAENFRTEAPATDPKVVAFKPRRHAGAVAYLTGLVAAAACVAVALGVRSRTAVSTPADHAQVAVQLKAPAATAAQVAISRPALQPVFGPRLLTLREQNAELAEATSPDQAAFGEWMNSIQLSSLPGTAADELRFDAHSTLQPDARTYRTGRPIQGKVEWTAFTFQK